MGRAIVDIALTVGDIAPSEELRCVIAQNVGKAKERVAHRQSCCNAIGVLHLSEPARKRDCASRRETSLAKKSYETPGCYRTLSKTLESLANPLGSLRVRLQAAPRSVFERASELGVLLVHYSNSESAQTTNNYGFLHVDILLFLLALSL